MIASDATGGQLTTVSIASPEPEPHTIETVTSKLRNHILQKVFQGHLDGHHHHEYLLHHHNDLYYKSKM